MNIKQKESYEKHVYARAPDSQADLLTWALLLLSCY